MYIKPFKNPLFFIHVGRILYLLSRHLWIFVVFFFQFSRYPIFNFCSYLFSFSFSIIKEVMMNTRDVNWGCGRLFDSQLRRCGASGSEGFVVYRSRNSWRNRKSVLPVLLNEAHVSEVLTNLFVDNCVAGVGVQCDCDVES